MSKFKAGDKVVRVEDVDSATFRSTGIKRGGIYTVSNPLHHTANRAITLVEAFNPDFTFSEDYFMLAWEQDDPLPPAPESVLYVETDSPVGTDAKLLVAGSKYGGLLFEMYAQRQSDGVFAYAGMGLDPDAALQLAHDLNRMANEIKRWERAQSGE